MSVRVSIVIPTYNGADFIGATLNAVFAQTFTEFEVIVSDDGSTDATVRIVDSFDDPRLRMAEDRSRVGAEGNWNRTLAYGQAGYVKLLPQDDILYPKNLEAQVAALDANESVSFVSVQRDIIGLDGTVLLKNRGLAGLCGINDVVKASRCLVRSGSNQFGEGAALLFRRTAADAAGDFDGSLPYLIDVDYWLRLHEWGPSIGICETHAAFRVSSRAWSNALAREQGEQYAAWIDRLASEEARGIKRSDILIGKIRARTNQAMRRAFYIRHRSHL